MLSDRITIRNIQNVSEMSVEFCFPESRIVVITGKNGMGKTALVKCFSLPSDPQIFEKSSSRNAIREDSEVIFELNGKSSFSFRFDPKLKVIDSKDPLPKDSVSSELPIPFGRRFGHFSLVSKHDSSLRANIASSIYEPADELIEFLENVYEADSYSGLKVSYVGKNALYFFLLDQDYYLREDHFSSGEYFLIQLFRLVTSDRKLIIIDELDVSLDARAQVNLFEALKPILSTYQSRLVVISHSLAFMSTVDEGGLYYLERIGDKVSLDNRSFGYIKSDLYGFRGVDRIILTEDENLSGFLNFVIRKYVECFFEHEIVVVGGKPQVEEIASRNDDTKMLGDPKDVLIFVDGDIFETLRYDGDSIVCRSPVDDMELFLWENRDRLLPDVRLAPFKEASRKKDTAKTFWKKVVASEQKSKQDLYSLICEENEEELVKLIGVLTTHLSLV